MTLDVQPDNDASGFATTQDFVIGDLINDDSSTEPLHRLMSNDVLDMRDQWLVQSEHITAIDHLSSADEEIARAYKKMTPLCRNMEAWHLHDAKSPLSYVVNRVRDFANDVATRNATPFMHRSLYRSYMPSSILSCFTISVLYVNRTPENTSMVMRAICSSARDLVELEAGRIRATPMEKVARTQALFLYQVVCLLDGDVTLRALGERDTPLLHTWLGELCDLRNNLDDSADVGDPMGRKQPAKEWEAWIFEESLRRTTMIAYSFLTLYETMKDPSRDDDRIWASAQRWTLSSHLWQAGSSSDFKRAWRESPHFTITNYSFEKFLACGNVEDVDEFAEILMSAYMGVDETKEFMSTGATST